MGKSVQLVEPTKHVGGMTSGGLGWVDFGRKEAIGGISHQFFGQVYDAIQKPEPQGIGTGCRLEC